MRKRANRLRSSLSQQMYHGHDGVDIDSLWDELNQVEAQIRDVVRKLKPSLEVAGTDLDQVTSRLPQGSALIEFKMYKRADFKAGKISAPRLGAYLLLSDREAPQQVYFNDLGSMEALLQALDPSNHDKKKAYAFLLGPFDRQIRNRSVLYIAPDGLLNLIAFAAISLPDGRYLVQRQKVNRLLTGRDFLNLAQYRTIGSDCLWRGGLRTLPRRSPPVNPEARRGPSS